MPLKIKLNSIFVDDQDKALKFYTEVLGFIKSKDIPAGAYRWITVVSPAGHPDVELVLEPNVNPAARTHSDPARGALSRSSLTASDFQPRVAATVIRTGSFDP